MTKQFFIIGSGFSKDFNSDFPVLSGLTDEILEYCDDEVIKKHLENLPTQLKDNTENLFSYLYSELPWQAQAKIHLNKAAFHSLSVALSRYFVDLEKNIESPNSKPLKRLIDYWNFNQSNLITFNYDTLIEKYFSRSYQWEYTAVDQSLTEKYLKTKDKNLFSKSIGLHILRNPQKQLSVEWDQENHILHFSLPYDTSTKIPDENKKELKENLKSLLPENEFKNDLKQVVDSNLPSLFHLNSKITEPQIYQCELTHLASRTGGGLWGDIFQESKTAKLYKLHGSINWYYTGAFDTASEQIYYSPAQSNDSSSKEATGLIPVIIPPLLQKDSYYQNSVLKSQWQKLANELDTIEDETEFYFLGYSFPPTDFLAWSLFSSHLPKNKPYKVYLVNYFKIEDNQFVGDSKKTIDYYLSTFLPYDSKNNESQLYKNLIDNGFVETGGVTVEISLSIIDSKKTLSWVRSSSTIQNLSEHLVGNIAEGGRDVA